MDRAVAAARRAFEAGVWSGLAPRERKHRLLRLAALITKHQEELALLETLDMGKPIRDALAFDLPETARCYAWYGEAIDKRYDEIAPTGADALATITREPLGVVAAVVPWNYPLMMAAWKVAPALVVGNSVILKPAEQASLSALRLAALAEQAGIPPGVFSVVPGLGRAGRPGARPAPGRRLHRLHRLDGDRQALHDLLGPIQSQARLAGVRRQVAPYRVRRLPRPGPRGPGRRAGDLLQPGRGLHRRFAPVRAARHLRRLHGKSGRLRRHPAPRQSAGPGQRAGRHGRRTADAGGHGPHRRRRPGRRAAAPGRPASADRQRRLLHRTDHLRLSRPGQLAGARGNLRAGAGRARLRRRGRGRRAGQ
ncbi:aldehyde dehydrogenase (NAD) domain protein [Bordetella pertussis STO1-CHOC-0017]|nr:aldehyde dehydrogenase (NAD) domain protein [Bordetella pertussis STO1-CHOC-0017]